MKKDDFEVQLNKLTKASNPTIYTSVVSATVLAIVAISWIFYFKNFFNKSEFLIISFVILGVNFIIFFGLLYKLKSITKRYAPHCTFCNKSISWAEKEQVLTTNNCPKCNKLIIENQA